LGVWGFGGLGVWGFGGSIKYPKYINKKMKKMRTKRTKSKINRRKTCRGGKFTHGIPQCSAVIHYTNLSKYIKKPYKWTMMQYRSSGCDMYIWKGNNETQHIHIHGFNPSTRAALAAYDFSITAFKERKLKAYLPNMTEDGYKDVLQQMYDVINRVVIHGKVAEGKTRHLLTNWKSPDGKPSNSTKTPTKKKVETGISIPLVPQKLFGDDDDIIQSQVSQSPAESA